MNYTTKKKWGSLCQRNRSQAKNHLFNHTERAFVSPIRVREYETAKRMVKGTTRHTDDQVSPCGTREVNRLEYY